MSRRTFVDEMTSLLRDWLPQFVRELEEAGRETVHTVVWLVGLSGGLLTLIAANRTILVAISPPTRIALSALLALVVLFGVLQRVTYQIAEQKLRHLLRGLTGHLAGLTSNVEHPWDLSDDWSREEIVRHFQEFFDQDYSFLLAYDVPLEKCREIYRERYQRWEEFEQKRLDDLGMLLGAYFGVSEEKGRQMMRVRSSSENRDATRGEAKTVIRWHKGSFILFLASCGCFLVALLLLAYATIVPNLSRSAA